MTAPRTLYDKIWDDHVVHQAEDGTCLLYIDRHLVHEVTSPQAFDGLTLANRKVWRLSANLAVSFTVGCTASVRPMCERIPERWSSAGVWMAPPHTNTCEHVMVPLVPPPYVTSAVMVPPALPST